MKKYAISVVCLALGLILTASLAFAYTGGTGIKATPHDLSSAGSTAASFGDSGEQTTGTLHLDRICIYCHAPHNTIKPAEAASINYIPLWNHEVTAAIYAMYSNGGSDDPVDANHMSKSEELLAGANRPGSVSRLCLSCHDATIATNSYGFAPRQSSHQTAADQFISDPWKIGAGGDLANHHPIGFDYDVVEATDDEIADADATDMVVGTKIAALLSKRTSDGARTMECVTCHDVHNSKNAAGAEKFLWKSDAQSAFCLTCHLKADVNK